MKELFLKEGIIPRTLEIMYDKYLDWELVDIAIKEVLDD